MNNLKRLHPSALLISLVSAIKSSIIPIIATLFIGAGSQGSYFSYLWIAILVFAIVGSVLTWFTFYYRLQEGELYIQKGIFVKKKRYIQRQRVQSINITAGILQRLFGMVRLEIETAGGGSEAEAQLDAITKTEAEAIRKELLRKASSEQVGNSDIIQQELIVSEEVNEEQPPSFTWKLGTEMLVAMALTSSGVGLIFSAVGALFSQFYAFIPESWFDQSVSLVSRIGLSSVLAITGLIFLALFISWTISSVISIIKYGGFQIEHYGTEIVISRGLLERRQLTLQLNRITSVRLVRNVFRQPLGFVSVYVESAGGGSKDEQASTLLIPLVKQSELQSLLADILPNYSFERSYEPLPNRALWRLIVRYVTLPVILTATAIYFFDSIGYFGFLVVCASVLLAWLTYKAGATGTHQDYMWIRYRAFSLIEVMVPRWKVQAGEKHVSVIQAWQGLATYKVTVQSSVTGKSFHLRDMTDKEADHMLEWYSYTEKKG
ncbi:PH domain-containing protein [Alkalicoccobacillus murimartini]|uniref:Membrane protein n=1 Tax=Alkalicoccobacillus murimartini TaxID=171685 RepID=A0ABT9YEL2_9BACI|nr:PH domain-containing protein [Alkalicoccobacillus murimartini]MDQ0205981.1 putative membrane protein [Alkalicoccobacillus murimartini]